MPNGFSWARGQFEDLEIGQAVGLRLNENNKIVKVFAI
jgi:hypothetical protein